MGADNFEPSWAEHIFRTRWDAIQESTVALTETIGIMIDNGIEVPLSWIKAVDELMKSMFGLIYDSPADVVEKVLGLKIKID